MRRPLYPLIALFPLLVSSLERARADEAPPPVRFVSWGGVGGLERAKGAASLGIDTHRVQIAWPERRDGYVGDQLARLEQRIRWLDKAGLNVIVHFMTHNTPDWFYERYPAAAPRSSGGTFEDVRKAHGWPAYYKHPNPAHPATLAHMERNILDVLGYLEEVNVLDRVDGVEIGVGMEGQLSYNWRHVWAFDDVSLEAYRDFLRVRYEERIDRLNRDWDMEYASFEDVTPPRSHQDAGKTEREVFTEFYRGNILRAAEAWRAAVRKKMSPDIWIWLTHFIREGRGERFYSARYPVYYMSQLKQPRQTVAIVSAVPGWQTKEDVNRLNALDVVTIGEIRITPSPAEAREAAAGAFRLGCDGFFVGVLENLIQKNGTPTAAGRETKNIIGEWRAGGPISPHTDGMESR